MAAATEKHYDGEYDKYGHRLVYAVVQIMRGSAYARHEQYDDKQQTAYPEPAPREAPAPYAVRSTGESISHHTREQQSCKERIQQPRQTYEHMFHVQFPATYHGVCLHVMVGEHAEHVDVEREVERIPTWSYGPIGHHRHSR